MTVWRRKVLGWTSVLVYSHRNNDTVTVVSVWVQKSEQEYSPLWDRPHPAVWVLFWLIWIEIELRAQHCCVSRYCGCFVACKITFGEGGQYFQDLTTLPTKSQSFSTCYFKQHNDHVYVFSFSREQCERCVVQIVSKVVFIFNIFNADPCCLYFLSHLKESKLFQDI